MAAKTAEKAGPTDLFGLPLVEPRDRRGRKAHKRSAEVSRKIALSRAFGRTVAEISAIVGLDEKTLRKYYSRELEKAPELVEAVLDEAIFEQAMAGRVGAQRLMKEMLAKGKAAVPLPGRPARQTRQAKIAPLGKKAQADADAQDAHKGTSWGDILHKPH